MITMTSEGFSSPNVPRGGPVLPADHSPSPPYRELTDAEIASLVRDIERIGYGVLHQYVATEDLKVLRQFVRDAVSDAGNSYTVLSGLAPVANTALGKMANSAALRRICTRAYELATASPAPDQTYYQVLRCLTGDSGRKHSMVFHFDTYVLTLLLPVEVPSGNENGELILLPNVRPIRRWYFSNLIDKVLLDNALTQWILRRMAKTNPRRFVKVAMTPGDLYFFWGYRSVHTNAPCDADKVRATALFQYVDPHRESRLKAILGR